MMRQGIIRKFLGTYIFLLLIAVLVLDVYVSVEFRDYYEEKVSDKLASNAFLVADILQEEVINKNRKLIQKKTAIISEQLDLRITVIDAKGDILGDSDKDPFLMQSHIDREEVVSAIQSGCGESTRFSDTLGFNMKYVAVPIKKNGSIAGIIRLAVPLTEIEDALNVINGVFIFGGLLAVIITLIIGYFVSKNM